MKLPFIISLPHCSDRIPKAARPAVLLSDEEIVESTDMGAKEIFGSLSAKVVLRARWSRIFVDLNRDVDQGGPRGVIPQIDYHGRPVYGAGLSPGKYEIERRLRGGYWPYHQRLTKALARPDTRGLIDCHSLNGVGPPGAPDRGKKRKDIVLSNNGDLRGDTVPFLGGITCPAKAMRRIKETFEKNGLSVAINDPYSGGFIIRHHGKEAINRGKFAFQIEINQDLFMDPLDRRIVGERLEEVRARITWCMISSLTGLLTGGWL